MGPAIMRDMVMRIA